MKYIKTYEGLFSFLKKKKGVKVTFDDILECLYDLTDESRIKNQLTSDAYWLVSSNLFVDEGIVFKNRV